jgi:N-acetylglucosaminyldiphosphoundecaprenol N-acetyl-beta-D-mannosaminyltransferase
MIFPSTNILGSKVHEIEDYEKAFLILLNEFSIPDRVGFVTVNNVHTIIEGVKDKNYNGAINNSFLSFADGKPLSFYAKLKGKKNISRIFGPTLFEKVLDYGQEKDIKHFFFGSSVETQNKMISNINNKYPKAIISGSIIPPFRPFTNEENEQFIGKMNESGADLFWIGLGAPKQELWMFENYKKLNRGVMIGIGAGFDYMAGNIMHAPEWMKNMALEWLYRLIQEPGRLWKRYLITNTLFIWYVFLEFIGIKKFK